MTTLEEQHPLGKEIAKIIPASQIWLARNEGLGHTWAGLWQVGLHDEVVEVIRANAELVSPAKARQLAKKWALPGVRDYSLLFALYISELDKSPDNSVEVVEQISDSSEDDDNEDDDEELIQAIPIWNHGVLEQANLTSGRHATHLVRHLSDFHEPTLAALRRQNIRSLKDTSDVAARENAALAAAESFIEEPTRWRDVVVTAIHVACLRDLQEVLGGSVEGPRRTVNQIKEKIDKTLTAIGMKSIVLNASSISAAADKVYDEYKSRLAQLDASNVVLFYKEHEYLVLRGVQGKLSIRRHLPRGLHLCFSDNTHRREDRNAENWILQSKAEQQAGGYYWSRDVPTTYAARKKASYFRLKDVDAVYRYVQQIKDADQGRL